MIWTFILFCNHLCQAPILQNSSHYHSHHTSTTSFELSSTIQHDFISPLPHISSSTPAPQYHENTLPPSYPPSTSTWTLFCFHHGPLLHLSHSLNTHFKVILLLCRLKTTLTKKTWRGFWMGSELKGKAVDHHPRIEKTMQRGGCCKRYLPEHRLN